MQLSALILSLLLTGVSSSALAGNWYQGGTLTLDPKRTVEVIGPIDGSLLKLSGQVDSLSRASSTEPIFILLNSPGGNILVGYLIADAISVARARGTPVVCVVGAMAASMAFNLMAYCDERFALPHSKLLFHPVRITANEGLTSRELQQYRDQLRIIDEKNAVELMSLMRTSNRAWFNLHYWGETFWDAEDLRAATGRGWLTIVRSVEGTDKLFTLSRPRSLFEEKKDQYRFRSRPQLFQKEAH
jgi:ATP-dependent protease ClpP protease subunit